MRVRSGNVPERQLQLSSSALELREALAKLPVRQRESVTLFYVDDFRRSLRGRIGAEKTVAYSHGIRVQCRTCLGRELSARPKESVDPCPWSCA